MEQLLFMAGLVSGLSVVLWAMRRDAPRHERVPVMSAAADWEAEGEGWKSKPEPEDTGAPGYFLPKPARGYLLHREKHGVGCPRCDAKNAQREKQQIPPLKPPYMKRKRDGALFCFYCNEAMYPMSEDSVMRYDPRYHSQTDKAA